MFTPTNRLVDQLFVDKVVAARSRSLEEKFLATGGLYEAVMERMRMGILMENPNASEDEVTQEIQRRKEIAQLLENRS